MKLAVCDVETTLIQDREAPHNLFWGLAIDGEDYRRFDRTNDLWKFLQQYPHKLHIYHHHDYEISQLIRDGIHPRFDVVRGGRVLKSTGPIDHEWRNSYALFPDSLARILQACGYEKPPLDYKTPGALEKRNRADTVDALEAFKTLADLYYQIFAIHPLDSDSLTAAGVSFKAATNWAGPIPVYLQDREYYRGGRVEAFRLGDVGEADCYDINSSYPYAFVDAPENDALIVADVRVKTDGPAPFMAAEQGELPEALREKLMFPQGWFRTAFWESNYERYIRPHLSADEVSEITPVRIIKCDLSWLRNVGELCKVGYATRLRAKKKGHSAIAYVTKIALNAMYGRLGMKPQREIVIYGDSIASGDDVSYYNLPTGGFVSFKKISARPKANYLFASFVTCNARARLFDGLMRTQTPFYCDTDSVYCPKGAAFSAPLGNELGAWDHEGSGELSIDNAKEYRFGEKEKRKGGGHQFQWTVKRAMAGKGALEVDKVQRSLYDKRDVWPDGSTTPVII